ncbi:hypothetical protein PROFUN_11953 [Planoprotostelium fungivorum]|uniref:Uncharacterized protein n=1 Tax=Planoprotostelium fungivorum TaxID=1890364 RepID=A0A2P6N8W8_9EUKA|nr:hypothetical protein PROFUN_11953 [Planoprotostelium fungivorum]
MEHNINNNVSSTLFLAELPFDITQEDLVSIFEVYDGFQSARIRKDKNNNLVAFLEFSDADAAATAKSNAQGIKFGITDKLLVVQFAYKGSRSRSRCSDINLSYNEGENMHGEGVDLFLAFRDSAGLNSSMGSLNLSGGIPYSPSHYHTTTTPSPQTNHLGRQPFNGIDYMDQIKSSFPDQPQVRLHQLDPAAGLTAMCDLFKEREELMSGLNSLFPGYRVDRNPNGECLVVVVPEGNTIPPAFLGKGVQTVQPITPGMNIPSLFNNGQNTLSSSPNYLPNSSFLPFDAGSPFHFSTPPFGNGVFLGTPPSSLNPQIHPFPSPSLPPHLRSRGMQSSGQDLPLSSSLPPFYSTGPSSFNYPQSQQIPEEASSTLYVEGLPLDATEREVAHIFRQWPGYQSLRILQKDGKLFTGRTYNLCFVEFDNKHQATLAMQHIQGYRIDKNDNKGIVITYAKTERKERRKTISSLPMPVPSLTIYLVGLNPHEQSRLWLSPLTSRACQMSHQRSRVSVCSLIFDLSVVELLYMAWLYLWRSSGSEGPVLNSDLRRVPRNGGDRRLWGATSPVVKIKAASLHIANLSSLPHSSRYGVREDCCGLSKIQTYTQGMALFGLALLLAAAVLCTAQTSTELVALQRQALIDLYHSTNGDNWRTNTHWLNDTLGFCEWSGVSCYSQDRTITNLNLQENNLNGTLPNNIGDLGYTVGTFQLDNNPLLTGILPPSMANFVNVWLFGLAGTNLQGPPPLLYRYAQLTTFVISGSNFSGPFPISLCSLPQMREIQIERNHFTGPIPSCVSNFTKLNLFHLNDNLFNGTIPQSLCNSPTLREIYLQNNQFEGQIPPCIGNLTSLKQLFLQGNRLSGSIPSSLSGLTSIDTIYLYSNRLTGSIPHLNSTLLRNVEVQDNRLSGDLPDLSGCTILETLRFENNMITGIVPNWTKQLRTITAQNTYIHGINVTQSDSPLWSNCGFNDNYIPCPITSTLLLNQCHLSPTDCISPPYIFTLYTDDFLFELGKIAAQDFPNVVITFTGGDYPGFTFNLPNSDVTFIFDANVDVRFNGSISINVKTLQTVRSFSIYNAQSDVLLDVTATSVNVTGLYMTNCAATRGINLKVDTVAMDTVVILHNRLSSVLGMVSTSNFSMSNSRMEDNGGNSTISLSAGDVDQFLLENITFSGQKRGLYMSTNTISSLFLDNLIANRHNGGAIIVQTQTLDVLSVRNANFSTNSISNNGAAMSINATTYLGDIRVDSTTISGHQAIQGGAVYITSPSIASITLSSSSLSQNRALYHGGAIHVETRQNMNWNVMDSSFTNNQGSGGSGGAIYLKTDGNVTFSLLGSSLNGNQAVGGGAIYLNSSLGLLNQLNLVDVKVEDNQASGSGGAFYLEAKGIENVTLNGVHFSNNSGGSGGAFSLVARQGVEQLSLSSVNATSNTAAQRGGFLQVSAQTGTMSVISSQFTSNRGGTDGGAFYLGGLIDLSVSSGTFQSNTADRGGGVYGQFMRNLIVYNNTLFRDNRGGQGGGMFVGTMSTGSVTNMSISFFESNSATSGGALLLMMGDYSVVAPAKQKRDNSVVYMNKMTFTNNNATFGGALLLYGYAEISETTFSVNTAQYGSAVALMNNSVMAIQSVGFDQNSVYLSNSRILSSSGVFVVVVCSQGQSASNNGYLYCPQDNSTNSNDTNNTVTNTTSSIAPAADGGAPSWIIIVAVVVAVAVLALMISIIVVVLKRRREASEPDSEAVPMQLTSLSGNNVIYYRDLDKMTQVGRGAFGVVYRAEWREIQVAVKQLLDMQHVEASQLDEFSREVALLQSLKHHPNLVMFIGISVSPDPISLITEFCVGGNLLDFLRTNKGDIKLEMKQKLILGIASGMLHLHTENIVHRDLAARNVLLSDNFVPKISDFGLSRKIDSVDDTQKTKSTIGPLKWMAPEAIVKKEYSSKSDVYSFSMTMWEILTEGVDLYAELSPVNTAIAVTTEGLRPIVSPEVEAISPRLVSIMKRCWHTLPGERPTFGAICKWLKEDQSHLTPVAVVSEIDVEDRKDGVYQQISSLEKKEAVVPVKIQKQWTLTVPSKPEDVRLCDRFLQENGNRCSSNPHFGFANKRHHIMWRLFLLVTYLIHVNGRLADGPLWTYTVVQSYPHDAKAFTQGLYWDHEDDSLYEGTGLHGSSWLRKVELQTGKVLKEKSIEHEYFGEGIVRFKEKIYQLTWQNRQILIYDRNFNRLSIERWNYEGWGITHDNEDLIVSDGTDAIRFLDPTHLNIKKTIRVTHNGIKIERLNELEYINGTIWANVWMTDYIIQIDPETGVVTGVLDLHGMRPRKHGEDVLNGIAYNEKTNQIYVTGKLWAELYEVTFQPKVVSTKTKDVTPPTRKEPKSYTRVERDNTPDSSNGVTSRALVLGVTVFLIAIVTGIYFCIQKRRVHQPTGCSISFVLGEERQRGKRQEGEGCWGGERKRKEEEEIKTFCAFDRLSFGLILLLLHHVASDEEKRQFPSMSLTNWLDLAITWSGPRDIPSGPPIRAPGITSFRLGDDFSASCLSLDSFSLQLVDDAGTHLYTNSTLFDGPVDFKPKEGAFIHNLSNYDGTPLPFNLSRTIYLPPKEQFYLIRYDVKIPEGGNPSTVRLLDYVGSTQPSNWGKNLYAWNDNTNDLWMVDLRSAGGFYFGTSYYPSDTDAQFQVEAASTGPYNGIKTPWSQFSDNGTIVNSTTAYQDQQVSIGQLGSVTLSPGGEVSLYFFRILQTDWKGVTDVAKRIRGNGPKYWVQKTAERYVEFLQKGKQPKGLSPAAQNFYENSILFMKHSQNPVLGTFVASFHPVYGFKVWARDASFSAMIMDSAGYHEEAALYLQWMSKAELRRGSQNEVLGFHTCYDWWTGQPVGFVEPQYDNAGAFIMAVLYHYKLTNDTSFLRKTMKQVRNIEKFFEKNVGLYGLAPSDYSIWEESSDPITGTPLPTAYFSFTQGMSYGGLISASILEDIVKNDKNARKCEERAREIKSAVLDHMWVKEGDSGYFARSIWSDTHEIDTRVDSGSLSLLFTGLVDDVSQRKSHLSKVNQNLTRLDYGVGRYWGDVFFYKSKWNPGHVAEVGDATPPWGVVTMFLAWAELMEGTNINNRLQWMLDHSADGLPVGEAIDGVSGQFVMSSCPDLYEYAGVYVWTVLMSQGLAGFPNPQTWRMRVAPDKFGSTSSGQFQLESRSWTMGNSLSLLTNCLPQDREEEGVPHDNVSPPSALKNPLEQKKALAPKPLNEEEEGSDWEAFEDNFGSIPDGTVDPRKSTRHVKSTPVNSSRDNISPLSTLSVSPSKSTVNPKENFLRDSASSENKSSRTNSITKPSVPTKPLPPAAEDMSKEEADFLSDMAVQYVPPKRAEPVGRHASAPVVMQPTGQELPPVKALSPKTAPVSPKTTPPPTKSRTPDMSTPSEENMAITSPSRLKSISFLEDENEAEEVSATGDLGSGGWGDDDFEMDLDDEPKEPVVKLGTRGSIDYTKTR